MLLRKWENAGDSCSCLYHTIIFFKNIPQNSNSFRKKGNMDFVINKVHIYILSLFVKLLITFSHSSIKIQLVAKPIILNFTFCACDSHYSHMQHQIWGRQWLMVFNSFPMKHCLECLIILFLFCIFS